MVERNSIKPVVNQRAEFAYKCVKGMARKNVDVAQKYQSYSKRLMAMVRINGLLATIVFIKSSSFSNKAEGRAYKQLYEDIENWLKSINCPVNSIYDANKGELMEVIVSLNSDEYRAITKEIMEFTNWLRRFAEGMIRDES